MKIQAITLHQPWASLVALRLKRYETRSWAPPAGVNYLAIHAGLHCDLDALSGQAFRNAFGIPHHFTRAELQEFVGGVIPLGGIVCIAKLGKAVATTGRMPDGCRRRDEYLFGDFSMGKFAWPLDVQIVCSPPIQCRGHQRIWSLPDDIHTVLVNHIQV